MVRRADHTAKRFTEHRSLYGGHFTGHRTEQKPSTFQHYQRHCHKEIRQRIKGMTSQLFRLICNLLPQTIIRRKLRYNISLFNRHKLTKFSHSHMQAFTRHFTCSLRVSTSPIKYRTHHCNIVYHSNIHLPSRRYHFTLQVHITFTRNRVFHGVSRTMKKCSSFNRTCHPSNGVVNSNSNSHAIKACRRYHVRDRVQSYGLGLAVLGIVDNRDVSRRIRNTIFG